MYKYRDKVLQQVRSYMMRHIKSISPWTSSLLE
jgi:hypothetical protein